MDSTPAQSVPAAADTAVSRVPAGWGRRVAAYLVDRAIVYTATFAAAWPHLSSTMRRWLADLLAAWEAAGVDAADMTYTEFMAGLIEGVGMGEVAALVGGVVLIFTVVSGVYTIPQTAMWSKTLGKRIAGIEVVTEPDGRTPVGWWVAL